MKTDKKKFTEPIAMRAGDKRVLINGRIITND